MAATNHTTNYNLPQYIGTDKPTYLGDWNSTMGAIDTQMKTNADNASGALSASQTAQTNANTALSTAQGADTKADTAITNAGTAQTSADTAQSVATSALSTANTANTAASNALTNIGDLSDLNTTATNNLVSAINEVNNKQDVYSTNEVKTNKVWVDGKPIYRKVVTGTLPTTNYAIFITINNLETPINENIMITERDGNKTRLPFVQLITNRYCDYYVHNNEYHIHFTAETYEGDSFIAILEYTKTTD